MRVSPILALILTAALATTGLTRAPIAPYEGGADLKPQSKIDELVFARLRKLGIEPAPVCSDAVFVRRAYLDAIGTLPTAAEARAFIADQDPKKRLKLVDRLLERDEFADYWTMKWCDLLRVKSEFPINLWPNAVQAYHHWIRTCIKENLPYDKFVREMLTSSGSNFRVPQVNFYRAVQSKEPAAIAQAVALSFMGVRPEGFAKDRWAEMGVFFSRIEYKPTKEWKEEIVMFDPQKAAEQSADGSVQAVLPDGTTVRLLPEQDPREVFANWLIAPKNPWFARNIVNRAWSWFMGRGIIHEPDDIRPDNPPSNPALLAFLERELVASHYDLKQIFRLILTSKTYQLSSIPADKNPEGEANFAHYPLRRLEAEVLADALCQITGTTEKYSSAIPEPFTYIPDEQRSVALADASVTSSFLEMFGRPSRDSGLESERNNKLSPAQSLHMLNSSHVQRKLEQSQKLRAIMQPRNRPRENLEELYLTIVSRFPTDEELKAVRDYTQGGAGRRIGVDIAWALVNSAEFLYRH
jgi:hypothetical protein